MQRKVPTDLSNWPEQLATHLSLGEIILLDLHSTCMTDVFIWSVKANGWLVAIRSWSEQIHEVQRAGVGPRNTHLSTRFSGPCSLVLPNLKALRLSRAGTCWWLLGFNCVIDTIFGKLTENCFWNLRCNRSANYSKQLTILFCVFFLCRHTQYFQYW